jgi:hypothetical protein
LAGPKNSSSAHGPLKYKIAKLSNREIAVLSKIASQQTRIVFDRQADNRQAEIEGRSNVTALVIGNTFVHRLSVGIFAPRREIASIIGATAFLSHGTN